MTHPLNPADPRDPRLRDVEASLRALLAQEAGRIMPEDRLHQIRQQSTSGARHGLPVWMLPVAASILAVLVGLGAWLTLRPASTPTPILPGTTSAAPSVPDSSPGPSSTASPSTSASASTSSTTVQLPVYYVGAGTTVNPFLLHRDFLPQPVADQSPTGLAAAAVTVSMSGRDRTGRALPAYPGLLVGWDADATATATLVASEIRLVLTKPGHSGLTAAQQRILVQSLVWTATAAAQANLPVRISVADGAQIFETMPAGVYQRPADTTADLAPICVLSPLRWTPVNAAQPVTVTGQACTFEAAFSWELRNSGGVVRSGHGTASSGCPVRGDFSIPLGVLPADDYTIRVWEVSMKDGSVFTEEVMPFTVR